MEIPDQGIDHVTSPSKDCSPAKKLGHLVHDYPERQIDPGVFKRPGQEASESAGLLPREREPQAQTVDQRSTNDITTPEKPCSAERDQEKLCLAELGPEKPYSAELYQEKPCKTDSHSGFWSSTGAACADEEEGGHGLVQLSRRAAAFRLQFILKLLTGPRDLVWRATASALLRTVGGLGLDRALFLMDTKMLDVSGLPMFYRGKQNKGCQTLHWLLEEPLVYGRRLNISSVTVPALTRSLVSSGIMTLRKLVNITGSELSKAEDLAARMGLRSLRVVNQLLHRWRSALTSEERVQLMDYQHTEVGPAEDEPFSQLSFTPDLDGLYNCGVSDEGCAALASALRSNPSHLRELDLCGNKVEDSGVKCLSAVLENPHCKLEILGLWDCGVSDKGCDALASALRSNPSHLRELDLTGNEVGDSGVKLLSAVLENPHCKLEILSPSVPEDAFLPPRIVQSTSTRDKSTQTSPELNSRHGCSYFPDTTPQFSPYPSHWSPTDYSPTSPVALPSHRAPVPSPGFGPSRSFMSPAHASVSSPGLGPSYSYMSPAAAEAQGRTLKEWLEKHKDVEQQPEAVRFQQQAVQKKSGKIYHHLPFHIPLLTIPTHHLLITSVPFTYMPIKVCPNHQSLIPRNVIDSSRRDRRLQDSACTRALKNGNP
ncbi:NACHT, LRR and PYD domains-containing protein 3 [Silurus meridionalis]|nr:NACHT, LRR and PYD domains-containing protein 3 [Silurus meridionalis]